MAPKRSALRRSSPAKSKRQETVPEPRVPDNDAFVPEREHIVPKNQLKLSEKQLQEDFTRVLTANDPNTATNHIVFSYDTREFKKVPPGSADNLVFHFSMDGCLLHKESDEAKLQESVERRNEELHKEKLKQEKISADSDDVEIVAGKNQFNYSDRAAQTFNNPMKERVVATEPPETNVFGGTVTRWEIYDAYMEEFITHQREQEFEKGKSKENSSSEKRVEKEEDVVHSEAMRQSLKILERMVNQNAQDEIYKDFKYWEDTSDQFREGEGSLLPLWRFVDSRTKRKHITAICWNHQFNDLFAVGFGSYDFMKQSSGLIYVYSLKNTSHPEYTFSTDSGVMCLDFHPQHSSLLAVGCYDGTVSVFDVRKKENKPLYVSTIRTGKHTDPVWQVSWQEEDLAKELNFFSVSSDGRVCNWVMSKNELKMELIMSLKLVATTADEPDEETSLTGLAGGSCFDFNNYSEHLFIVGTEEGKIHKCSKAYSGQYLETYEGHHMAVYAVRWNPFHPRVFLSCSADWTVKLWDHNNSRPLMSFDLGNAVGDIAWSPHSSTSFAAVTNDGKVHVFDLSVNKHEPLCEQKVVKRAKLTHVTFNRTDPVILVGDDRGGVNALKLSPNLRKKIIAEPTDSKHDKEASKSNEVDIELEKLEKLLLTNPQSTPQ